MMNKNFDFDAGIEELAELTRRAHMIDATLRAARDKAQDAAALFRKADETPAA